MSYAKVRGLVPWEMNHEEGLYKIAEQPEFTQVLHEEVQARGLVFADVAACVRSTHRDLLPPSPFPLPPSPSCDLDETIVIKDLDFTAEERAALVTFMKVQSKWLRELAPSWREDISGKAYERNVEGRYQSW